MASGQIVGLVDLVLAFDSAFQKRIEKKIPNYRQFIANPLPELEHEPLRIGPLRRYGSAVFTAFMFSCVFLCAGAFGIGDLLPPNKRGPLLKEVFPYLVWGGGLFIFLLMTRIALAFFRGGEMTIGLAGVELKYGSTIVFCPWSLFDRPRGIEPYKRDRVAVGVNPNAIHLITVTQHGDVVAVGDTVRTKQLWFRSADEIVLMCLYEVRIKDLAKCLVELGRNMGNTEKSDSPPEEDE